MAFQHPGAAAWTSPQIKPLICSEAVICEGHRLALWHWHSGTGAAVALASRNALKGRLREGSCRFASPKMARVLDVY